MSSIYLFDEATFKPINEFSSVSKEIIGHSNRIHAVKFTEDPNIFVSGSWDNTVKIWDIRSSIMIMQNL